MMGIRPAMMTEAVITFGRIRFTAPSMIASFRSPIVFMSFSRFIFS